MKATAPTIIEFVTDPHLLNLSLSLAQRTRLKAGYGLPLTGDERDLWRACTGRERYPRSPFREMLDLCGARGGKDSRILAPSLLYESLYGGHERQLSRGEFGLLPLVAQDFRATKISFGYLKAYLTGSSLLASMISRVVGMEIQLVNGLTIQCFPSTQTSLRGYSNPAAGMNELSFWRLEGQSDSDVEIQASIRRGMLSFPNPKLLKISTPYMKSGVVWADFKQYFGQDSPDVLVWKAPSVLMNPSLRAERLAQERRLDPMRYAREYEAEFAEDLDTFLPHAVVEQCRTSVRERPPLPRRPLSCHGRSLRGERVALQRCLHDERAAHPG
jgi:hypothetical protein